MWADIFQQLVLGAILGLLGALLGGALDLRLSTRKESAEDGTGGPLLLLVGLGNTVIGALATVISFVVTGSIAAALVTGIGFFLGFGIGFLLLAWLLIRRDGQSPHGVEDGVPGRRGYSDNG